MLFSLQFRMLTNVSICMSLHIFLPTITDKQVKVKLKMTHMNDLTSFQLCMPLMKLVPVVIGKSNLFALVT